MFDFVSTIGVQNLIQTYGLWVLFGVVMFESLGVPMPGETALISAALYSGATHQVDIVSVVGVAALAAIIGDNFGYLIGRSIGLRLIVRYGRYIGLDERRLKIGQYLCLRHGGKIVFFGRFVAFLRAFAAVLAGANLMPWRRFLIMNALGESPGRRCLGSGPFSSVRRSGAWLVRSAFCYWPQGSVSPWRACFSSAAMRQSWWSAPRQRFPALFCKPRPGEAEKPAPDQGGRPGSGTCPFPLSKQLAPGASRNPSIRH